MKNINNDTRNKLYFETLIDNLLTKNLIYFKCKYLIKDNLYKTINKLKILIETSGLNRCTLEISSVSQKHYKLEK